MYSALAPANYPSGRWPGKGHHPLVFGQQFAINSMTRALDGGPGIFSINGPPGTGKTTLLRDLVAHVVVERAKRLAALSNPRHAFDGLSGWESDQRTRRIRIWKPEFTGFEMVVASANNGAVENITLELPGGDAIDDDWKTAVDYFPDLAARAIGGDKPVWGLLAARLGNKSNRQAFVSSFWWDSTTRNKDVGTGQDESVTLPGLKKWLDDAKKRPSNWNEAVAQFRNALNEEEKLRAQRELWSKQVSELAIARSSLTSLSALAAERRQATANAVNALRVARSRYETADARAQEAKGRKADYLHARPGFVEILLSLGREHRSWRIKYLETVAAAHDALDTANAASHVVDQVSAAHKAADKAEREANEKIAVLLRSIAQLESQLRPARTALGKHFVDHDTSLSDEQRELSSPWTDRAWNDARAKVFLEALNLHKAFVAANATIFQDNLFGAVDMLSGSVPRTAPHEAVKAAWQTLFAVVPVVSSTFASFDRLFSNLKREDIGWLLIDEAGQGIPQAAVGALWRSKRAVIVGDPLQLEPILPLPFTAQQALRSRFKVEATWVPGRQSIQRLADRISKIGTSLPDHEGKELWVSSPLRVHRRCDREMFEVANKIAYNGMMVFGTVGRSELGLPVTTWINVVGRDADRHWIPDEGLVVVDILDDIHQHDDTSGPIYVISPFRDVTQNLKEVLRSKYKNVKVGTIHTVQGKESDVVLLVLGGNPERPGAKKWASEKPNLLNVAVSRAKRRLYVIGNRDEWKGYEYFRQCADTLKHRSSWSAVKESENL